jgi:NTE family protein
VEASGWLSEGDGVFRGGGVKGIALAGALLGFYDHPTRPVKRWHKVAGASAGAIIASWLAVRGDDAVPSLKDLLFTAPYSQFADYPAGGKLLGGGANLLLHHGLAHGQAFLDWFDGKLGHATFAEVKEGEDWRLKLVAVDVTNQSLLLLPDDLAFYRDDAKGETIDPDMFSIARAARMSMSIPYFFEPVVLYRERVRCTAPGRTTYAAGQIVDRREAQASDMRCQTAGDAPAQWEAIDPEPSLIVDGGTLSNFPVWIFDADPAQGQTAERMTFGFTLTGGKGILPAGGWIAQMLPWPVHFGMEIFHTAQSAWDRRFESHSSTVRTVTVDAGDVATTDFTLPDVTKNMLIQNGRSAAARFLDDFDPAQYMNTYGARFPRA